MRFSAVAEGVNYIKFHGIIKKIAVRGINSNDRKFCFICHRLTVNVAEYAAGLMAVPDFGYGVRAASFIS